MYNLYYEYGFHCNVLSKNNGMKLGPLGSCYVDIGHKAESHKLLSFSSQISIGLTGSNPILSGLLTSLPS